jgi:hypothetical protein
MRQSVTALIPLPRSHAIFVVRRSTAMTIAFYGAAIIPVTFTFTPEAASRMLQVFSCYFVASEIQADQFAR